MMTYDEHLLITQIQWLIAVDKYRAEHTSAPNFAFALAQRKTNEKLRDSLDLSCLEVRRLEYPVLSACLIFSLYIISHTYLYIIMYQQFVVCGAEPIRLEVMRSFFDYFAPCGFNPLSLLPSYGLAEFTLCATSQTPGAALNPIYVDQQALSAIGKVVIVEESAAGAACYISVGNALQDRSVCRIVNPETCEAMPEGHVGEIWMVRLTLSH